MGGLIGRGGLWEGMTGKKRELWAEDKSFYAGCYTCHTCAKGHVAGAMAMDRSRTVTSDDVSCRWVLVLAVKTLLAVHRCS